MIDILLLPLVPMTDTLLAIIIVGIVSIAVVVDLGTDREANSRARHNRRRLEIEKGAADEHHATLRACRRDEVMIL
jgi:hypothetical protein